MKWTGGVYEDSVADRYQSDPDFGVLVDTFCSLLWNGKYSPSELRQASIFAATRVECMRIRPLIFDPNDMTLEQGVLNTRRGS